MIHDLLDEPYWEELEEIIEDKTRSSEYDFEPDKSQAVFVAFNIITEIAMGKKNVRVPKNFYDVVTLNLAEIKKRLTKEVGEKNTNNLNVYFEAYADSIANTEPLWRTL